METRLKPSSSVYKTEYVVPFGVLVEELIRITTMSWYKRWWYSLRKGTFELRQLQRVSEYIKALLNNVTISAMSHQ